MILMQNLRKNQFTLSKIKRIWWVLIRAHKSLQNLHFDLSLLCKVHNVWPWKNTEEWSFTTLKSYAKFEEKNWLVVWKITWGIWQIFIKTLESVKIGTFLRYSCSKQKIHELKIYRGLMCCDNEKWCKNWRGIDLPLQNWHEGFDEF